MKLNESILANLNESADLYDFARDCSVNDFIADGRYTFAEKINYIADQLEESGNVDTYEEEGWNDYLLDISKILRDAAIKIKELRH